MITDSKQRSPSGPWRMWLSNSSEIPATRSRRKVSILSIAVCISTSRFAIKTGSNIFKTHRKAPVLCFDGTFVGIFVQKIDPQFRCQKGHAQPTGPGAPAAHANCGSTQWLRWTSAGPEIMKSMAMPRWKPMVNVDITMEDHHIFTYFYWVNQLKMAMFNSYVKWAEGNWRYLPLIRPIFDAYIWEISSRIWPEIWY